MDDAALSVDLLVEENKSRAKSLALELDGLLLTMFEGGNPVSERVATFVRDQLPKELVLDIVIPRSPASAESFAAGQPLVLRSPHDEAARA